MSNQGRPNGSESEPKAGSIPGELAEESNGASKPAPEGLADRLNDDPGSEHLLSIETLRTCLDLYKALKGKEGPSYLAEFAREQNVDVTTMHRRLDRFEKAVSKKGEDGFKLFDRRRGTKAKVVQSPVVEAVMFEVSQIVESWDRLMGTRGVHQHVVRIGMTLSAARIFAPLLTREFPDVWLDVTQTKAQRLLERRKQFDLVLTAVPSDFNEGQNPDSPDSEVYDFELAVIVPHGHWTEMSAPDQLESIPSHRWEKSELWRQMAAHEDSLCLLTDEPDMYPFLDLPSTSEFPSDLRIQRIGSTALCHEMVVSSPLDRSMATISVPQFLTDYDRERVHIVPTTERIGKPQRFVLLRPGRPPAGELGENPTRTAKITKLEKRIREEMRRLAGEDEIAFEDRPAKRIYHTTRIGKKIEWTRAELWWKWRWAKVVEHQGKEGDPLERRIAMMITGLYAGQTPKGPYKYIIRGRALRNQVGQYHLVCHATLAEGECDDEYAFSCVCPSKQAIRNGTISGLWQGTATWADQLVGKHTFQPCTGCVIISSDDLDDKTLNLHAAELKNSLPATWYSSSDSP